jgi:predicted CXXCH cytochrome family protein
MLANREKKSLLKTLATGTCGAIILMAALTAKVNGEIQNSEYLTLGTCLYSQQLASDPALREAFEAEVALYRDSNVVAGTDYEELYVTDIDAGIRKRTPTTLDRLSTNCLSCHDGVMATSFNVRIKNDPNGRVMGLEDIIGGHPVGMEYEKYISINSSEYRREARFSRGMVYAEGKIGCLTCHNPLNIYKGHLVMANDRSALCFSCHNK